MARNIRFNHTVEHRFVFADGEEPQVVNGDAFPITGSVDVPDTDLRAQVWRCQRGSEVSVHDREAGRLTGLKDADGIAYATEGGGELAELPVVTAPDPTDPVDRTPREEVERAARDAGHTPEGLIEDHDRHRDFARRAGIEPGGPAAAAAAAPTAPRPARPPAAAASSEFAAGSPGRDAARQTPTAGGGNAPAQTQTQPQQPPPPGSPIQPASPAGTIQPASGTGQGTNAPAPAIGQQRTPVDIRGTMATQPGQAPGAPTPQPVPNR